MAEQLLDQIRDVAEGQIDFEGQKLVDLITFVGLTIAGGIAFLVGFFLQDITLALKVGLASTALTFLAVVPPWPIYNRHPLKWLPVGGGSTVTSMHQSVVVDEKTFANQ